MANAVERLWQARSNNDWRHIEAVIHLDVDIYLPAQDLRPDRDQFITMMHIMHGYGSDTHLERFIVGNTIDVSAQARVLSDGFDYRCFGAYKMQEGLICSIEEAWLTPGSIDLDLALFRR